MDTKDLWCRGGIMNDKKQIEINKTGVIVYHYPVSIYRKGDFCCVSIDGKTGEIVRTQKTVECSTCEFNKFGSGENNQKACYQSRVLLFYQNNTIEEIKVKRDELPNFSKYVLSLLSKGRKTYSVITKIYEKDGIKNFRFVQELTETEIEQVMQLREIM